MKIQSKVIIAVIAVAAVVIAVGLVFWRNHEPPPGDNEVTAENQKLYQEMVSAFSKGVSALDADANDRALEALTRATQLVPEEPAAWLNLGLVQIRMGDEEAATRSLERAKSLAPESAAADRFLGLLESRRGRPAEAILHFREAVAKDPDDLQSRYALASEIEREGQPGADEEIRDLFAQILKKQPANLAALMQQARLAVKAGDATLLKDIVARLRPSAENWPERTREQFRQVAESAESGDMRQAALRVTVLRNLLLAEPAFRASIAELQSPVGVVGEPVEQFLSLPAPKPLPSPADLELSFAVKPFDGSAASAAVLAAVPPVGEGKPLLAATDGNDVRVMGAVDVTLPFPGAAAATEPGPYGLLWVDWNSDDSIDLACAGAGGFRLFRRNANGAFDDVTQATKLADEVIQTPLRGIWTADIELDGDLDFIVGPVKGPPAVLRNNGDGTFEPLQPFDGIEAVREGVWCDLDHDGLPDVTFRDEAGGLNVFINQRSGRYARREAPTGLGTLRGLAVADQDSDGRFDLITLRENGSATRLNFRRDEANWSSQDICRWNDLPSGEIRLFLADLDNNGSLDLLCSAKNATRCWLGEGSGQLRELSERIAVRVGSLLDLNGDGRLDLAAVSDRGLPVQALNHGKAAYHWQAIRPRGAKVVGDGRISSFGLGGEIEVRSGLLVQKQIIAGPTVHFGLGDRVGIDVAKIVWPNGTVQAEFEAKADQVMTATQRLKGSCPFVYAYDGKAVRFVTDFLWRSPLGLRINAQDTAGIAQTEDWIKIGGDQLAPRDGYYDVRLTAELWETHYFDLVSLMVVDHPRGTEVFVDERFARTPPPLTLHPTGPLHSVTARDDQQHDVTDVVEAIDGRYLDTFGRGPYQGVTRDHWVEVDIGDDVPRDQPLRLIARGWVHPTDSSINVALSQGQHAPPQGLVLEVLSAEGTWTVAKPDLGFPAGKSKTIVIDLDGLFAAGVPRKIRLKTNLEVFWDQLAVAVARPDAAVRTQVLAPEAADLRYRGFSLITQADAGSPELPHYGDVTGTTQRWRDLEGYYTRFGDVRELLLQTDDRYVIANAGDEVSFRFAAPSDPPEGWVRDFVLIGDGWNKDGDFNTAYSGTVLPLPSHASTRYDRPPVPLQEDPVYQRYPNDWETYHTRYVSPAHFERGLRAAFRPAVDTPDH